MPKFVNFFKNYNLMFAFSTDLLCQLDNTEVKAIVNCYDKVTYEKNLELKCENYSIDPIHFFLLNSLLNFFKEIYKIIIILVYLSLLKR
jgi:hypothetical protein